MSNSNWTTDNIPDQTGRVVIITGANSGIGFESAKAFADKNARVILAVRDQEKGALAQAKIKQANPHADIQVQILDLAELESVKSFAEKFKSQFDQLDLLINNAGIMMPPYGKTRDGFESQFGANHLGHFALTARLFPLLQKTAGSRIVNVSSGAHKMGNINFKDLTWENRRYLSWKAYGDSKIANLYFTYELQRKLESSGSHIMVVAAHPGVSRTQLFKGIFMKLALIYSQSAYMGSLPILRAAIDSEARSGDYYGPSGINETRGYPKLTDSNELSHDQGIADRLWQASENLTRVSFQI